VTRKVAIFASENRAQIRDQTPQCFAFLRGCSTEKTCHNALKNENGARV
jgi:hypothetical protein